MSHLSRQIARFLDGDVPDAPLALRAAAGAAAASVFAPFAILSAAAWAFAGPEIVTRAGIRVRVDLLTGLYPLGALTTGALFGLLQPCIRSRRLAALAGIVALLPVAVAVAACVNGAHADWRVRHSVLALVAASLLGGPLGWSLYDPASARRRRLVRQRGAG